MPTLITSYSVDSAGDNTATLTTPSFTPSNGEVIAIKGSTGFTGQPLSTPTGGSQTYTQNAIADFGNFSGYCAIWTCVITGSPGSMTISTSTSVATTHHMVVERWGNAKLAGSVANAANWYNGTAGAPSVNLTTAAAGSVVTWCSVDEQSVSPASRTYLNINGSPYTEDGLFDGSGTVDTVAYFAYGLAGAAGTYAMGLSAPTGQKWNLCGIEIQDASSLPFMGPPLIFRAPGLITPASMPQLSYYAGVSTAVDQNVLPVGIPSEEKFGNVTVVQNVAPVGVTTEERFGNVSVVQVVTPSGVTSEERFGNATVTPGAVTVSPVGIPSEEKFGNVTASNVSTVSPVGIPSEERFGNVTVSATYTVSPAGIPSEERFGSPTVVQVVSPYGIPTAERLGNPAVTATYTVSPTGVPSEEKFGNTTVTPGAVTISPVGIPGEERFGNVSVQVGVSTINAFGIPSTEAFGNVAVTPGAVTVSPYGIPTAERFGNVTVSSVSTISPVGVPGTEQFGNLAVTVGPATVSPVGIGTAEAFGNPTITGVGQVQTVTVTGIRSTERFGNPNVFRDPTFTVSIAPQTVKASISNPQALADVAPKTVKASLHS